MAWDTRVCSIIPEISANGITIANGTINLSNSTSALEYIFQARNTEPITHLGCYVAAIVGTTPTYKASIQGVNTTGTAAAFPDGTIKGGGSPASKTFNPSSLGWTAATFKWLQLDNSYTPSVGEFLSAQFIYDSGTVDASNYVRLGEVAGNALVGLAIPRAINNASGTRTHRTGFSSGGWRTATRRYGGGGLHPLIATGAAALTTETAIKFTVPSNISTTKLAAIQWVQSPTDPSSAITIKGYSGGAVTDTTSAWTDSLPRYAMSANSPISWTLASPWTVTGGQTYRVSFSASAGSMYYADVTESADWQMVSQLSEDWSDAGICISTRSGGNWTDTTTRRLNMNLWFKDTTYSGGSSGGGSLINSQQLVRQGWIG